MARQTLLQIVQDILSYLDSDEVNSIDDTVEADQVATIVQDTYYYIADTFSLGVDSKLFNLQASGDSEKPTHMKMPANVRELKWVKYDVQTADNTDSSWREIDYLTPHEFCSMIAHRDESSADVTEVNDYDGSLLLIHNDRAPRYYTSFDDEYVVFDAHDSEVDSTLQSSKTQVYGEVAQTFSKTDSFEIPVPDKYLTLIKEEAKAQASVELKQITNNRSERRSRTQQIRMFNDKHRTKRFRGYYAHGRRRY